MNVMIDDWVQFFDAEGELTQKRVTGIQDNGKYIQTEETDTYYNESTYKPIPFTPEIMEKNGFKLNEEESKSLSEISKTKILAYDFPNVLGNRFFIEYDTEYKKAYLTDHCYIVIQYVHEFQQLLRLMERKAPKVKEIADNFTV